jgi:hypothetical protein
VKNDRCWARKLDGCSDKLSGDHIVSVAAWPGANRDEREKKKIFFQRGEQLPSGELNTDVKGGFNRSLTVKNLTAKVLCTTHNEALSALDTESRNLTAAIEGFWETCRKRWIPGILYAPREFVVDGPRIERWFIKTLATMLSQEGLPIGGYNAEPGAPTDELVDIVFGHGSVSGHMGLSGAASPNEGKWEQDFFGFGWWSWFDTRDPKRTYIAGYLAEYRGLRFVLNLDKNVPVPLARMSRHKGWEGTHLLRPMEEIELKDSNVSLKFTWPTQRPRLPLVGPGSPPHPVPLAR